MSVARFDDLLQRLSPHNLARENSELASNCCRKAVCDPSVFGEWQTPQSIAVSYKLGILTVCAIVTEVCHSKCNVMVEDFVAYSSVAKWASTWEQVRLPTHCSPAAATKDSVLAGEPIFGVRQGSV